MIVDKLAELTDDMRVGGRHLSRAHQCLSISRQMFQRFNRSRARFQVGFEDDGSPLL